MSLRARSKPVAIVLDPENESLGVVEVTLCEIPSGLLEELQGESTDQGEVVRELNRSIAEARRRLFILEDALTANAWPKEEERPFNPEEARVEQAQLNQRIHELKTRRKEAREARDRSLLELVAWGVCNHKAADFIDEETEEPIAYEAGAATYDTINYRITSPTTLNQYISIGRAFITALSNAIGFYQRGKVQSPRLIWDEAKKAAEELEAKIEQIRTKYVNEAIKLATGEELEDTAAELGEELDPNSKRPATVATTPAQ